MSTTAFHFTDEQILDLYDALVTAHQAQGLTLRQLGDNLNVSQRLGMRAQRHAWTRLADELAEQIPYLLQTRDERDD